MPNTQGIAPNLNPAPTLDLLDNLTRLCLGGPCTNQAKSALGNFVMSGPTIINSPLQITFIVKNKHID